MLAQQHLSHAAVSISAAAGDHSQSSDRAVLNGQTEEEGENRLFEGGTVQIFFRELIQQTPTNDPQKL